MISRLAVIYSVVLATISVHSATDLSCIEQKDIRSCKHTFGNDSRKWDKCVNIEEDGFTYVEAPYLKGNLHGDKSVYWIKDSCRLDYRTNYSNGLQNNDTIFHSNGLIGVSYFKNGKNLNKTKYRTTFTARHGSLYTGIDTLYQDNGEIHVITPYLNGLPHGEEQVFFLGGGGLKQKKTYRNGFLDGPSTQFILITFDPDCHSKYVDYYKKDVLYLSQHYNCQEHLTEEKLYPKNNLRYPEVPSEYIRKEYFVSGQLSKSYPYKACIIGSNDNQGCGIQGKEIEYYESGQLKRETEYKKGKRNGKDIEYKKDGSVLSKSVYKDDLLVGMKKCFDGRKGNESLVCK